jgi:ubiquinone/menaquinone biosynthesis C-methylase UbiE
MTMHTDRTCTGTHAVKDYFDNQADQWDLYSHHDPHKLCKIMHMCDLHPGQRVLDVACGTGVLFPWLLAHDPALLAGIDISDGMTRVARQKYRDNRLQVMTLDYYQMETGEFDRIIIYNAYPHFFDKERLAKKTYNLLAFGGRFVVAHNKGRESLNEMHTRRGAGDFSMPLEHTSVERHRFEPYFNIDCCVDNDDIYILSGIKTER